MATYTNAPAVSAAVSATASASGTLFTCAANSYAVINVHYDGTGGGVSVTIGGRRLVLTTSAVGLLTNVYVGPGQAVAIVVGAAGTVEISGTQYTNQA
jgi:hypothetical protein